MYRVGFGDCFLLSLPVGDVSAHILIDCGVHSQGDLGMIPEIVDDISSTCDRHLHLVIGTHAHQDHISGFATCEEEFRQFTVDEVWLPWTERESDPLAHALKQKHLALTETLRQHLEAKGMAVQGTQGGEAFAAVANAAGNATALALLKPRISGG